MKTHTLSMVHIISDEYLGIINAISDSVNMGNNNFTIRLVDNDGQLYWAYHSWWTVEKYLQFKTQLFYQLQSNVYKHALLQLKEFVIDTSNMPQTEIDTIAYRNIEQARELLGLHYYQDEENQTP